MPEELAPGTADLARFAMPEFTRALRGVASASGLGRVEHAAVFGPLLAARKLAEQAGSVRARLASFDAARLERAWLESIDAINQVRPSKCLETVRSGRVELPQSYDH